MTDKMPDSNPWMDGNAEQFIEFSRRAGEGPVVMINLLKFYNASLDGDGTGREAYARYGVLAEPFVEKHGGKMIWAGDTAEHLIGDIAYGWDAVLLVKWPTRQKLMDLAGDEDYQAIAHHRENGLQRTMLIAMDEMISLPAAS